MSLRNSLKQAIAISQEKCCTVAMPRACNNATNQIKTATAPATSNATATPKASNIDPIDATQHATTVQQALKKHATTAQQLPFGSTKTESVEKNLLLIRAWLFRIEEPQADHYLIIDKCKSDPEAMQYFLRHANGQYENDSNNNILSTQGG